MLKVTTAVKLKKELLFVLIFVVFAVVLVGAYMVATQRFIFKPNASSAIQNVTGQLAKKGTSAFAICHSISTNYALVGGDSAEFLNSQAVGKGTSTPAGACLPVTANASQADPFVGQRVLLTGVYQNGIFYASVVQPYKNALPTSTPHPMPRPTATPKYQPTPTSTPRSMPKPTSKPTPTSTPRFLPTAVPAR